MATKQGERRIQVFCPTHKKSFRQPPAPRILCEGGDHALSQNFPHAELWEYCCDCQRYWPSQPTRGGQSKQQCPLCDRLIVRRYLCSHCEVMSVESDDASVKRKGYRIDDAGAVGPSCPGCGREPGETPRRHECPEAGGAFTSARAECPFCAEMLAPAATSSDAAAPPDTAADAAATFPALAEEYLARVSRQKVPVRLDPLNGLLVKDANNRGELVLIHEWGVPGGALYLLPLITRLGVKSQYQNYLEPFYDCARPTAGRIRIVRPAVVEKVAGGWRLREKGVLEVADAAAAAPARTTASSAKQTAAPPKSSDTQTKPAVRPFKVPGDGRSSARAAPTDEPPRQPRKSAADAARKAGAGPQADQPAARPPTRPTTPAATRRGAAGEPWLHSKTFRVAMGVGVAFVLVLMLNDVAYKFYRSITKNADGVANRNAAANLNSAANANATNANATNANATNADANTGGAAGAASPPPGMAYVPGGEFDMGGGRDPLEVPRHSKSIAPFFIDIHEVTCEEYARFVKDKGHRAPPDWKNGTYPAGWARRPVTGVDWDDAAAYALWAGKRLPSEEEWEFAARGRDGRRYPWGDEWIAGAANAADSTPGRMEDVGSHPAGASPFGLQDMVGNAWEWTASDLKAYPGGTLPALLPEGIRPIRGKVIRGGCRLSDAGAATTTFRRGWHTRGGDDYSNTGFRCALSLK